ncbi:uncharacterized protein LOC117336896 [Pecten maximus]|uniref:uncharacterized protein LOC117336896 n=1 Tax=Pecten maximus TaxID=6579 RepID=UPI001458388F|nr:uncharacterized protein LOC117336896 [Pecten maximus]
MTTNGHLDIDVIEEEQDSDLEKNILSVEIGVARLESSFSEDLKCVQVTDSFSSLTMSNEESDSEMDGTKYGVDQESNGGIDINTQSNLVDITDSDNDISDYMTKQTNDDTKYGHMTQHSTAHNEDGETYDHMTENMEEGNNYSHMTANMEDGNNYSHMTTSMEDDENGNEMEEDVDSPGISMVTYTSTSFICLSPVSPQSPPISVFSYNEDNDDRYDVSMGVKDVDWMCKS